MFNRLYLILFLFCLSTFCLKKCILNKWLNTEFLLRVAFIYMNIIKKRLLLTSIFVLISSCGSDDSNKESLDNTPIAIAINDNFSLTSGTGDFSLDVLANDTNPLLTAMSIIKATASSGIVYVIDNHLIYQNPTDKFVEAVTLTYTLNGGSEGHVILSLKPSPEQAARFLLQSSFGANQKTITEVTTLGITLWLEKQQNMAAPISTVNLWPLTNKTPITHYSRTRQVVDYWFNKGPKGDDEPSMYYNASPYNIEGSFKVDDFQLTAWWDISLHAPDQLRQRMAFALSELMVVSNNESPLNRRGEALAVYYDLLVEHAFGHFKALISDVSTSMAMGIYLSHQGNQKGNLAEGRTPDENYAREIMQLFTIGLYQLNKDGSSKLDQNGQLIPTYTQTDVENMARVFTGWSRKMGTGFASRFGRANNTGAGYDIPMECYNDYHDTEAKEVLGTVIPAGQNCEQDLDSALDIILAHENVAPFVSKHLISRFVTSNPTPAYIKRISTVFDDKDGDLKQVIQAILLDTEARLPNTKALYGRVKSPIQMTAQIFRALAEQEQTPFMSETDYIPGKIQSVIQPTRSFTVFNFYSPDFGFTDDYMVGEIIAPEAELLTDVRIAEHNNNLIQTLNNYEVQTKIAKDPLADWQAFQKSRTNPLAVDGYLNLIQQLTLAQKILGNDYAGMSDTHLKQQFIDELLPELNLLLVEGRFTEQHLLLLNNYLVAYTVNGSDQKQVVALIRESIRFFITSNVYSIQE